MKISKERQLKDIQADFQKVFPFLKIEFYSTNHGQGEGSQQKDLLDPEMRVGEVAEIKESGLINLNEELTTGLFEEKMKEQFGLNVQVFRKSYNRWLQTWVSDIWSLKEQNRRGEMIGDKGRTMEQIRKEKKD